MKLSVGIFIYLSSFLCKKQNDTSGDLQARRCSYGARRWDTNYAEKDLPLSKALKLPKRKQKHCLRKKAMSILNCFAGGVLLGTSFIGLLPEIREVFDTFQITWPTLHKPQAVVVNGTETIEEGEKALMPMAEIVITCGLFIILIVEQLAHGLHHRRHRRVEKVELEVTETMEMASGDSSVLDSRGDHDEDEKRAAHEHQSIRSLLLVATLSVHSLLEGIAMGLQNDVGGVLSIFFAVIFHKFLMAFSMGTNLVKTKQCTKRILAAALIFSVMSPLGISIGLIIKVTGGDGDVATLVNVILQAIATGTFLYITFFEVLVAEFEAHGMRVLKVVALLVGYGAILGSIFAHHS